MLDKQDILSEYNYITQYIKGFENSIGDLYMHRIQNAFRIERSVKGETIHRGFYCPSPSLDIVIGNLHRGHLLPKASRRHPTYEYYFNKLNLLSLVIKNTELGQEHEFLLYEDNTVIGAYFDTRWRLESFSKCKFHNNRITHYDFYQNTGLQAFNNNIGYQGEAYYYNDQGLSIVERDEYLSLPEYPTSKKRFIFRFRHNDDGFLTNYTQSLVVHEPYYKEQIGAKVFDITVKRKV